MINELSTKKKESLIGLIMRDSRVRRPWIIYKMKLIQNLKKLLVKKNYCKMSWILTISMK